MGQPLKDVTVFLDRDGTLNEDRGYIQRPEDFCLFPGVEKAIARLNRAGSAVVLITNQSGIARGLLTEADLQNIHAKLEEALSMNGAKLDGIFVCPHHPNDGCLCRKPNIGLIDRAVATLQMNGHRRFMIGDKRIDIELAQNIEAAGVLVRTSPYSLEALRAGELGHLHIDYVATDLSAAVDWILAKVQKTRA